MDGPASSTSAALDAASATARPERTPGSASPEAPSSDRAEMPEIDVEAIKKAAGAEAKAAGLSKNAQKKAIRDAVWIAYAPLRAQRRKVGTLHDSISLCLGSGIDPDLFALPFDYAAG